MAQANQPFPIYLDVRDPNFTRVMMEWSRKLQCEMHETVIATQKTIAASRALMARADRILARK